MKKYYKIFFIPAIMIIIVGFFSGFSSHSEDKIVEDLLIKRTNILQAAYYGKIEMEKAEDFLREIETYPLVSEDIQNLRAYEATELDIVKHVEVMEETQIQKIYDYISYNVVIRWYMRGLEGDYVGEYPYSVVIKESTDGYKLAEFSSIGQ